MTVETPISGNPLQEICDWFDELQVADSYQGFTYTEWVIRCPTAAFEAIKAHLRENKGNML